MNITKEFIKQIEYNKQLNYYQLKILNIKDNTISSIEKAINYDIPKNNINLLMLLKGDFDIKTQEQIIDNYNFILKYNNINAKTYSTNDTEENEFLEIYCDGACKNNPGNSGSGIVVYKQKYKPTLLYGQFIENGTNNIAELNSLLKALKIAKESMNDKNIKIYTDSKYSIDCISKWAYSWKNSNWSKKGGEIKNLELIQETHYLFEQIKSKVELIYVKAHSGIQGNELADKMANLAIFEKNEEYLEYNYSNIEEILK